MVFVVMMASLALGIAAAQEYYPIEVKGKVGYVDEQYHLVIAPKYDDGYFGQNGYARVKLNGRWGFVNVSSRTETFFNYEIVSDLSDGYAIKRDNKTGLMGFVDIHGHAIIDNLYDARPFSEGRAAVKDKDGWTYIDTKGQLVFPRKRFEEARQFKDGVAVIKIYGLYGVIDGKGYYLTKPIYKSMGEYFGNGLCYAVMTETAHNRSGFVDENGNMVVNIKAAYAIPYDEGFSIIGVGKEPFLKWSVIDTTGKLIVGQIKDLVDVGYFVNGIANATLRDDKGNFRSGYICANGNMLIKPQFDVAQPFVDGVGRVFNDSKRVAFVDTHGRIIDVNGIIAAGIYDK